MSTNPDDKSGEPTERKHKDPLHGVKLETVLTRLVTRYGWDGLGNRIKIRC